MQRSDFNMKNRTISNEIIKIADRYTYPRARTLEHPFQSPPCLLWVVPATPHPVACRLSEGWHLSPGVPSFLEEEKGNECTVCHEQMVMEMTLQKVNGNLGIFQDLWSVNNCAASQSLWNNIREATVKVNKSKSWDTQQCSDPGHNCIRTRHRGVF